MNSILHITEVIKGGIASYIDELYLYHKKDDAIKFQFYISKEELDELKFVDKKSIYTFNKKKRSILFFIKYFFSLIKLSFFAEIIFLNQPPLVLYLEYNV